MGEYLDELLTKNGIVSYNPECIRKKSNFSKSSKNFKFDSDTFDPEELLNNIPERSPKLDSLLKNIASLDESDMKRDGHMYKHFIYRYTIEFAIESCMVSGKCANIFKAPVKLFTIHEAGHTTLLHNSKSR